MNMHTYTRVLPCDFEGFIDNMTHAPRRAYPWRAGHALAGSSRQVAYVQYKNNCQRNQTPLYFTIICETVPLRPSHKSCWAQHVFRHFVYRTVCLLNCVSVKVRQPRAQMATVLWSHSFVHTRCERKDLDEQSNDPPVMEHRLALARCR